MPAPLSSDDPPQRSRFRAAVLSTDPNGCFRCAEDGSLGAPTAIESRGAMEDVQTAVQEGLVQQIVDELRGIDGAVTTAPP